MPLPLLIGAAAAPVVGGILGNIFSSDDSQAAEKYNQQALDKIMSISDPQLRDLVLEKYKAVGQYTPEMEEIVQLGPSAMSQVQVDPRLKQAQMGALAKLQQVGEEGLNLEDKVALNQIRNDVAQQEQARQGAILQEMQARGAGGSGAEIAAKLSSSQAAANRASNEGMNVAAQAQKRALEAILASGNLGGSIRSQDFSEESDKAKAADVIAAWNAANSQSVKSRNTAARNTGQMSELDYQRGLSKANTDLNNTATKYNVTEKPLTQFNASLQKAGAQSGALKTAAQQKADAAHNTQQQWSNIGQGVGGALGAVNASGVGGTTPQTVKQMSYDQAQDAYDQAQKLKKSGVGV